ncbi:hypothetical protein LWI29_010567 [Acer saccharum]|uniref:Uncharacterized protein n=1 Tax=Acer saccharum TaxID=4024 RepID=A0AA39SUQ2_ACESA|nr:hypothetical protein LWI29_010567 [Acer saccharum]
MNKLLNSPNLLNNQVDDTIIGHNADSLSFQKMVSRLLKIMDWSCNPPVVLCSLQCYVHLLTLVPKLWK